LLSPLKAPESTKYVS